MNLNIKHSSCLRQRRNTLSRKAMAARLSISRQCSSYEGGIRVPSYTASKSGVMGVTRLMANEWAKHNINVNAIAPGYMATNNTQQLRADEQRSAEIINRVPAGRWDCRVT
ncbi:SDR family NAD(P)-dependent oxidoreductase [Escherichia coli]